jgi:hypothetical protein
MLMMDIYIGSSVISNFSNTNDLQRNISITLDE